MGIKSIQIKNLLSFDELLIPNFKDINCIVGINNVGKSNLLKLIRFFYNKLENIKVLPPELNHRYSSYGSITITYNMTSRLKKRLKEKDKQNIFKEISSLSDLEIYEQEDNNYSFSLSLIINSNDSIEWSIKDTKVLRMVNYYYPFFDIEGRHISLHNWDKLWSLICSLKSFNLNKLEEIIFDNEELKKHDIFKEYNSYVNEIKSSIQTSSYTYKEKFLTYLKIQLNGDKFLNEEATLETQSDGTNAHKFIETFLKLLIVLTRRDYITPTIYIDEPEIGLHPKKNEELLDSLYQTYSNYNSNTPYPTIIFSTHSANVVKQIIKLFVNQQVFHFYRTNDKRKHTRVSKLNSKFEEKFLNIFSDNESRLFFSTFILFVEGETELEIFSNKKLLEKFSKLKKIDVYKSSSNVIAANINPSNINASIPYLFLFDADKIYTINKKDKYYEVKLKNKNGLLYILPEGNKKKDKKFNDLLYKYKKGFNNEYKNIYENLLEIKEFNNLKLKCGAFTNKLEKNKFNFLHRSLNSYLVKNNVRFVKTTIEETLINRDSKKLFLSWLEEEYKIDFDKLLFRTRIAKSLIFCYKRRTDNYDIEYLNPRKNLRIHTYFIKKRRLRIDNLIVDYIRILYFNGKFDNLKDTLQTSNNIQIERKKVFDTIRKQLRTARVTISEGQEKAILRKLEICEDSNIVKIANKLIKQLDSLNIKKHSKTNGWASSFLNFSIEKINKESLNNEEFINKFRNNFRELYDIITEIEKQFLLDR